MSEQEYVDITFDGGIQRHTELAFLISYGHHDKWIPFSVVEDANNLQELCMTAEWREDVSTVAVKEWFAVKEEFI